jgi:outer membrane porin, OprD family
MRFRILVALVLITAGVASFTEQARAQSAPSPSPSPAPSATPAAFTVSGTLRAYDFDRLNSPENAANPNRSAFNAGAALQAEYNVRGIPLTIGGVYYGAYPFGLNGASPQFNPGIDNTLPGFALNTLGQAYVRYHSPGVTVAVGNLFINHPWDPASDTRIKPSLYQGIDGTISISRTIAFSATRTIRFESRTASTFERNTLLTSSPAGNPANPANDSAGLLRIGATWKPSSRFTGDAEYYQFFDIANLTYVDGIYNLVKKSPLNPTLAAQFVSEGQTGRAFAGHIDNTTYGAQIGITPVKNLVFTAAFDQMPWVYTDVRAASATAAGTGIFLPSGGTVATAQIAPGVFRVAYGGLASPFSDAYATDPLFTTSISQGMVDRRSAGTSYRAAFVYTNSTKQLRALVAEGIYDYGNQLGANRTYEFNVDVTYDFNRVRGPVYKGLSLRERYADRTQPTIPFHFQYVRTQLEYDF